MLPASAALVASLALQAGVTRYTASLQTQARYITDVDALAPLSTTGLELLPTIGLTYEERTSTFGIAYLPRLVMVVDSPPPQFFNQASLNVALQPSPTLRLSGSASGCYGTNDFRIQYAVACGVAVLGQGAGAGPQPIPQVSTVKYMSASGALGFESRPAARVAVSGTISYLAQGGADAPTRAVLPLQRGPSFLAALGWTAGRDDSLTTSLSGSYYAFIREASAPSANAPATSAWVSQVLEVWQHATGRATRLRLGLGVGVAGDADDLPRLVLRTTFVVGEIGLQQAFARQDEARPLLLDVGARVSPFVDFTSGLAYERADAFASLGWPLDPDWRLEASVSAGIAVDGVQRGQATGTGQLTAAWLATRWLRLSTGLSGVWQRAGAGFPASTIRQVSSFFGVTFLQSGEL